MVTLRTVAWTAAALVAFAANSWLCRLALRDGAIDPASFTTFRLAAGALVLWPLPRLLERGKGRSDTAGNWPSGIALFVYAAAFSWAYVSLEAGTGALILFGAVQITMIGSAWFRGERPGLLESAGGLAAAGGLVWLVRPGADAPAPLGFVLMAAAGIAWGAYSLRGRGPRPIAETAGNFDRAAPLAVAASLVALAFLQPVVSPRGLLLAVLSGAVTSGLGYVAWYTALPGLRATTAAIVQLAVPVLAALGGVAFMGERATGRLVLASIVILGGVALAVAGRRGDVYQNDS